MAKTSPGQFITQVRQESAKVTWPSRKETMVTTMVVFGFVIAAAFFFFFVDQILSALIKLVLGIGA
jgi:preprotein translocase subunit SecE